MTILTKTFKDVTIFSDKMKCFSLQTNNHGLHNGDQSRVDRGNGLSEFCKSAHISFCFILFTKATKLFSHSGGRQRFKNEAPWCFLWEVDKGVFPFSFYGLCAQLRQGGCGQRRVIHHHQWEVDLWLRVSAQHLNHVIACQSATYLR